ncbi:MAG: hypothetical protein WBB67_01120 [bacterium]
MKIRRLENGKLGRHGETALGAGLATALLIKCGVRDGMDPHTFFNLYGDDRTLDQCT